MFFVCRLKGTHTTEEVLPTVRCCFPVCVIASTEWLMNIYVNSNIRLCEYSKHCSSTILISLKIAGFVNVLYSWNLEYSNVSTPFQQI